MIELLKRNAWRIWPMFGLALSLFVLGNTYGQYRARAECDAQKTAVAIHTAQTEVVQAQTTTQVVTDYAQRAAVARERGREITKKVSQYVPQTDQPTFTLPGGWRMLHDAAATGELPITTSGADAVAVTPQDAASTVSDNYATCRANALQLDALQEWVRKQAEVTR